MPRLSYDMGGNIWAGQDIEMHGISNLVPRVPHLTAPWGERGAVR